MLKRRNKIQKYISILKTKRVKKQCLKQHPILSHKVELPNQEIKE